MPLPEGFSSKHHAVWPKSRVVSSGAHLAVPRLQNGFHLNTLSFELFRNFPKKSPFLAAVPPALGLCPSSIA